MKNKISFRLICIALLLLQNTLLTAQEKYTISGIVKDADNGETSVGASVYLEGTGIGTLTNEYGFYSLTAPVGTYTLVVSYLGYDKLIQKIALTVDQRLTLKLRKQATSLKEVIISAEEGEQISLKSPQMSAINLKIETIKQMPAVLGEVDILKSIQKLPGVTNNGEGSGGFHVRGGAADQNLVLLDEAIIYNTSHLFGFFSIFNADAIKNVKLYKGAIPARYGGRVSSVLDVRQKEGNDKEFEFTGGVGLISSRLAAEGPIVKNKGSFLVAARGSYAHLFLSLADIDNMAYFYDINLKGNYQLNKNNKLYLSGYYGKDVMAFSGLVKNDYGNLLGNIRWNHIFNNKLFSNLSLIYSKYDYRVLLDFIAMDWNADIKNYNLKYDFKYYLNPNIKLSFGASGIFYKFNSGEIKPTSKSSAFNYLKLDAKRAFEGGLYISTEQEITSKLTVRYGLRYSMFNRLGGQSMRLYANNQPVVYNPELEVYEEGTLTGRQHYGKTESIKSFGNFEPRLGLSFQLNENAALKAGYTRASQYLHLLSNTTLVTPLDVWAPSGKYIAPQIGNQYALGYFQKIKKGQYSLETEVYYKTVDNRVDYVDGANLLGNNHIETEILEGEMRAYGLEFLFRKNQGKLTGWLAYTLSKSEQKTGGGKAGGPGINNGNWYNTSYDRTHNISLTASYRLNEKWSFGANAIFQTGRPATYPNSQYKYEGISIANYGLRNGNRLPAYHRLDISATYRPNHKPNRKWKGEWVFSLYNVYNRKNAASISFGQNRETGANEATRTAIFGIVPSVTYNFKF